MTKSNNGKPKQRKGFAVMDDKAVHDIATLGGISAHAQGTANEFNSETASKAGRKGGRKTARNRKHMAEIGRRGGLRAAANRKKVREENTKKGV